MDCRCILEKLVHEQRLSPEILLLPWDENTRVFEYLCSESFRKQIQDWKTMTYVEEQLTKLTKLIKQKSITELSLIKHELIMRKWNDDNNKACG